MVVYRDAKGRGIYQALSPTLRGIVVLDSIYQISWIKIKKEFFVNNGLHLVRVCLRCN